jgi:hypothetical protein
VVCIQPSLEPDDDVRDESGEDVEDCEDTDDGRSLELKDVSVPEVVVDRPDDEVPPAGLDVEDEVVDGNDAVNEAWDVVEAFEAEEIALAGEGACMSASPMPMITRMPMAIPTPSVVEIPCGERTSRLLCTLSAA